MINQIHQLKNNRKDGTHESIFTLSANENFKAVKITNLK